MSLGRLKLEGHAAIRYGAVVAVVLLCVRRILFLAFPNLLPRKGWHPESVMTKWIGIAVHALTVFPLTILLIGLPFLLVCVFWVRKSPVERRAFLTDSLYLIVAYAVAFFILTPPK